MQEGTSRRTTPLPTSPRCLENFWSDLAGLRTLCASHTQHIAHGNSHDRCAMPHTVLHTSRMIRPAAGRCHVKSAIAARTARSFAIQDLPCCSCSNSSGSPRIRRSMLAENRQMILPSRRQNQHSTLSSSATSRNTDKATHWRAKVRKETANTEGNGKLPLL